MSEPFGEFSESETVLLRRGAKFGLLSASNPDLVFLEMFKSERYQEWAMTDLSRTRY